MQAPSRGAPLSPETERRTKLVLYAVSALGFLGLAGALALFTLGGGSDVPSAAPAIRQAGCTIVEKRASKAGTHVARAPRRAEYNTWPPTSGPHHPRPVPYAVYSEPVEQFRLVHNLEHGAVVVQYGDGVPQAEIDRVTRWYGEDPNGLVVAPLAELGKDITLGAWTAPEGGARGTGRLARCRTFTRRAFEAFTNAYAFRGPERFPKELLAPGS